jgi:hypothetical protein
MIFYFDISKLTKILMKNIPFLNFINQKFDDRKFLKTKSEISDQSQLNKNTNILKEIFCALL